MAERPFRGASIVGKVGAAMAFLKLKSKYDDYIGTEEGRIVLTSPSVDNVHREDNTILVLDTHIPSPARRARKKKAFRICCGIDCSLLRRAIAIVLGLYTLYYCFKALKWALTPALTGLEDMPELDVSLGCVDAPYIYNGSEIVKTLSVSSRGRHDFDVRGVGVGTISMLDGNADATEIVYRIIVRSDREHAFENVKFTTYDSELLSLDTGAYTPGAESNPSDYCMRFDVDIYVPPKLNVKHLVIESQSDTHISFPPGTLIANVDHLEISLRSKMSKNNIIRPIPDVVAKKVTLKVADGWIVGEATVVDQFQVSTELGSALANLKVTHSVPTDPSNPTQASVETIIGSGRADITVVGNKTFKRKILDMHTSMGGGDMYLTYKDADYNGKIQLYSKSYSTTGAQKVDPPQKHHEGAGEHVPKWTHFVGNKDGGDELYVTSRQGWAGLYY